MAKKMKIIAIAFMAVTIGCSVLYLKTASDVMLTLSITFGTTAYHFWMRLMVGLFYDKIFHNRIDYRKKWFHVTEAEQDFYKKIKVKKWKNKMPTYDQSAFDTEIHSWEEILQAMCQSELVHETIMVFSFLPIVSAHWFGALPVFVVTSVLAAGFDALFVIMQRFNRPRILRLIKGK